MWITDVENRIDRLMEKLTEVEVKRLQLDYLLTVAKRLNLQSDNCERCNYLKEDIDEALMIVEKADDIRESQRRAYNTRIKGIISHLRKEHSLKSKNFYAAQYSNLGLVGGVLAGIWFLDQIIVMLAIVLMGPLIGKFIGTFKDRKNTEDLI